MLVSVLGVLVCRLAVRVGCFSMLLSFLVLSRFVVMDSFAVVVHRGLVMAGSIVVVLTGGVFQGHGVRPFKKHGTIEGHLTFGKLRWRRPEPCDAVKSHREPTRSQGARSNKSR